MTLDPKALMLMGSRGPEPLSACGDTGRDGVPGAAADELGEWLLPLPLPPPDHGSTGDGADGDGGDDSGIDDVDAGDPVTAATEVAVWLVQTLSYGLDDGVVAVRHASIDAIRRVCCWCTPDSTTLPTTTPTASVAVVSVEAIAGNTTAAVGTAALISQAAASKAVPLLVDLAADMSPAVRLSAVRALRRIFEHHHRSFRDRHYQHSVSVAPLQLNIRQLDVLLSPMLLRQPPASPFYGAVNISVAQYDF